jgi:hypothetical protein
VWTAEHVTVRLDGEVDDEDGSKVPVIAVSMPRWRAHSLAVALDHWSQVVAIVDEGQSLDESELAHLLHTAVDAADDTSHTAGYRPTRSVRRSTPPTVDQALAGHAEQGETPVTSRNPRCC